MQSILRILIVYFMATFACAQETWNLQDMWDVLLANNLKLKAQENLLWQSETDIAANRALLLPQFALTSNYRYQSELPELQLPFPGASVIQAGTYSQYDIALGINQSLFTGFRNINLLRSSSIQRELISASDAALRQQLLYRAGLLFYDFQKNKLQQETLQASLRRADNQLHRIRSMLTAKQATAFDTLEIANRKLEIKNNLSALQDYTGILQAQISDLIHVDSIPDLQLLDLRFDDTMEMKLDDWQQKALGFRKELERIDKAREIQRFQSNIRRASYYPQLYANASYHYARPGVNFFVDEWMDYYSVGVQLVWSIWNWNRDANSVQKSILEEKRLENDRHELEFNVKNEVRQAFLQMLTAAKQVRLQQQLVDQEYERYRITNERFEQGLTTILDMNSAEESLTAAQLQLQEQIINWYTAKLRLAYASGDILSVN